MADPDKDTLYSPAHGLAAVGSESSDPRAAAETFQRRIAPAGAGGSADALLGTVLSGKYRINGVLAEGGMGRIYTGEHCSLDRKVAVKVVLPELSANPDVVSRFRLEAQMCAQLSHPNVVSLLDFGQRAPEEGGELYAVMELVEGATLEALMMSGAAMPLKRVAVLVEQLLIALDYAHGYGVVHRDVKPANVVVQKSKSGHDRVKLIDFGIAQAQLNAGAQSAGIISGTPEYMAPEQALGETPTGSVDIYSTGIVLFQMLTGCIPFFGTTVSQILGKHLAVDRPDPIKVAPERNIPEAFAQVCMKAMALEPQDRYESASDFAEALVQARRSLSSSQSAGKAVQRPSKTMSRPVGRYSLKPGRDSSEILLDTAGAVSSMPPSMREQHDFGSLMKIEAEADALLASGESDKALATLLRGLKAARAAFGGGQKEMGQAALRTFSIKLGKVYAELGQLELRRNVLLGVLNFVSSEDVGRAELLSQLALAEQALNNTSRAERFRAEARVLAERHGDRKLIAELTQLHDRVSETVIKSR